MIEMDGLSLEFTHCEDCEKTWLVGLNGKDIRKEPRISGEVFGTGYIALDNPTLEIAKPVPEEARCPECDKVLKVESSTGDE
jgi:hypothetical protein